MGYDNEHVAPVLIDLETIAIDNAQRYLEKVEAPSNYVDPEKIAAFIEKHTHERLMKAALDMDLCRIVCVGIASPHTPVPYEPYVLVARTAEHEPTVLETVWNTLAVSTSRHAVRPIITFNGRWFDLPVLVKRSFYNRIKHPYIDLRRWNSPHPDVAMSMCLEDPKRMHTLSFYCERCEIPHPDPEVANISGADIHRLCVVENTEASWDLARRHCLSDVTQLRDLARRAGVMDA